MKPRISFPVVIIGPISNGTNEHPGLITRVWGSPDADTVDGPISINAMLFPDGGGEAQWQNQILLFDSREAALRSTTRLRCAYWAANS